MNYSEFFKDVFLFQGLDDSKIEEICKSYSFLLKPIERGNCISFEGKDKGVAFVVSGDLEVIREKDDGTKVVLNQITKKASVGLLSVFSAEEYPTRVVARVNSELIVINESTLNELICNYPQISRNVIYFLADRINFLNKKIATFSGTRTADRLFSYLLLTYEKKKTRSFSLNCKKCSEAINAGRASVYRAIEQLVSEGVILFEDKIITLLKTERK